MNYIIVQQEDSYEEYPITKHCSIHEQSYRTENGELYQEAIHIQPFSWTMVEKNKILYLKGNEQTYERNETVFLAESNADINFPGCSAQIFINKDFIRVEQSKADLLYMNQDRIMDGTYSFEEGTILLINTSKVIVGKDYLTILGAGYHTKLLPFQQVQNTLEQFPHYKRSPRVIKRVEEKKIRIDTPPVNNKMGKRGILQMILPPLGMLAVTVAIGILLKRGVFMLMSISATAMTTVFTVVKYIQDRREHKAAEAKKKELYGDYLLRKRKEIYSQWTQEKEAYHYNYPELSEIADMVNHYDSRIYERSSMDDDFLTFTVGHYMSPTRFTVEDKTTELDIETNEYLEDGKMLKAKYSRLDKPQVVDLKNAHFGLVGEKSVIHEQLKLYVSQLAFMQSYHDLQFAAIYEKEYEKDFAWMKWLSHARLQGINVLGLVGTERARDQVLGSLQQILKERKQRLQEGRKETQFLPHYVFLVDEPKILMDHSIMEFLGDNDSLSLGVSLIYTSNQQANLPENIGTVVLLEDSEEGRLLLEEKEFCDTRLHLYRTGDVDLEMMARNLGVLVHEQGIVSHIPESITFFDMYGVRNPEELKILKRWMQNNSSKTLAVPLGARAADDILELNLHEKAHGPHGLVAGTTGSGKSETVQSYILSLAVNFHPYEVGFLLIDYKGGGMANLFKDLPHLLGTITNLDGSESMRALASIKAELKRRQQLFGECDVNHINAYNDLFKEGKAKEPIPHLFIISDEFAELKKEQPEFMKELVSTARIGRSLGVHLILATQKPTGVVDDQIWSNSKFKLCLKVQNEADSKEVLHTPDAASITQAGRAYLQVGNNEIYELFQSAWSGAMYIRETESEVTNDNRIYQVNELGQGELINQDLRGTTAERKAKDTQLGVTIAYIQELYQRENNKAVKRPWLPSLKEKIINPNMQIVMKDKADLELFLGLLDVPEEQAQVSYKIDLAKQGNIVYIASGGYGKSVFLVNIALQLAARNRVSAMNLYALDFGSNALISLSNLPHMADYIMLDEEEKFRKFRELMLKEMSERKRRMAEIKAQNFAVYNETAEESMRAIVILIDNYDAVKEMGFEMEEYFTKLTRDGISRGIYVIMTASRVNAIRFATLNNFKNRIGGFNFEPTEVKTLVGKSDYTLQEIKGRAMVKCGESANIMQIYLPVEAEDEIDYNRKIQAYVKRIVEANPGEEAEHIPILPEELSEAELINYPHAGIAVGLDKETVVVREFSKINTPFLILGESGSGKTNVLKLILNQLAGNEAIVKKENLYLFDSKGMKLFSYKNRVEYSNTAEKFENFANRLLAEIKERKMHMEQALEEGKEPQEILNVMESIYVLIDDIDDFCDLAGNDLTIAAGRMEKAIAYGVTFIVTADVNKFKGSDAFTRRMKTARSGLLFRSQGYLTIFPTKMNEDIMKPDAVFMLDGQVRRIRIPRIP